MATSGWIRLPERQVLAVEGALRQKFLHGLLSNDVARLAPGGGCRAALLDVKGHVLALMRVSATAQNFLLEIDGERLGVVQSLLEHYRVAAPVRFQAKSTAVVAIVGEDAAPGLERAGIAPPGAEPESHVEAVLGGAPGRAIRAGDLPRGGLVLHVAPEGVESVAGQLWEARLGEISRADLDVLRIEDGRVRYGVDVTEDNLLHETGLLAEYHSSTKGCYVGQEVVARLEGRGGHVNKRLRGLRLEAPIAAGSTLAAEGANVGSVTSAGISAVFGPIAMGYVDRSHGEPGTLIRAGEVPATVVELPFRRD